METFQKKKVEIIVEATMLDRIVQLARRRGLPGYSVLRVVSGEGRSGPFDGRSFSQAMESRMFVVVAEPEPALAFVEEAQAMLKDYRAIIILYDVEVLRDHHF
jgi:PII-like signaling protein